MDKIVGKTWRFIFLILSAVQLHAQITLKIVDQQGVELKQAGVGRPLMLEVSLDDSGGVIQNPVIKGTEKLYIRNAGMQMISINGHATTKHKYLLRIDKPGTYKIGPAVIENGGQKLTSNTVSIRVANQQIAKQKEDADQKQKPFLRLSINKRQAVVGESIACTVRFYFIDDDTVALRNLLIPELTASTLANRREPVRGVEVVDGTSYSYIQVVWDLYPDKVGDLMIPAFQANYDQQMELDDFFSTFSRFLGAPVKHKRVYSNAQLVSVDPLPESDRNVQAIGLFSHVHARIEPGVAREGEGMVLVLEVEGSEGVDRVEMPELQQVPESFKYYDSKQYLADDRRKKTFEFIVQGLQPGDWEIPSQTFSYFDVKSRRYKTLETQPLMVTVLPQSLSRSHKAKKNTPKDAALATAVDVSASIRPLNRHSSWRSVPMRQLPMWLFVLLLVLPAGAVLARAGRDKLHMYRLSKLPHMRKKYAFTFARKDFEKLVQKKAHAQVYHLFTTLFVDRCGLREAELSQARIEALLRDAGVSSNMIGEWNSFFQEMAAYRFGGSAAQIDFFMRAGQWLDKLEKVL